MWLCWAGDALFTAVQALHPEKDSAKVTGMLLEMTEPEILRILEDPDALAKKASLPAANPPKTSHQSAMLSLCIVGIFCSLLGSTVSGFCEDAC